MADVALMVAELHRQGVRFFMAGDRLRWRAPKGCMTTGRREFFRRHQAELVAFLAAEGRRAGERKEVGQNAVNSSYSGHAVMSRLEIAQDCLNRLVRDDRRQREIVGKAKLAAKGWLFLGADYHRHILSEMLLGAVEQFVGKRICFSEFVRETDDGEQLFQGWFLAAVPAMPSNNPVPKTPNVAESASALKPTPVVQGKLPWRLWD